KPDNNLAGLRTRDERGFSYANTEPGISIRFVYSTGGKEDPKMSTLIILNAEDTIKFHAEKKPELPEWVQPFAADGRIYLAPTRGADDHPWTKKSPPNYVERAHVLLGQTVDEGRLWDVIAIQQSLAAADKEKRSWRLIGRGQAGILAA